MPGSISVPVRKAVADGLAAYLDSLAAFNGTTDPTQKTVVSYGYLFNAQLREHVYTGRSRGDTPPAALRQGRNIRDEKATFDLNVLVRFTGGDAYDADLRLDAIGTKVEEWLADRKSNELGVTGLQTLTVVGYDADYVQLDRATGSVRTYKVQFTGRLT